MSSKNSVMSTESKVDALGQRVRKRFNEELDYDGGKGFQSSKPLNAKGL